MIENKARVWLLAVMMVWYGLLFVGAGLIALLGMAFGSEAYRNAPIPIAEMAIIYGPVLLVAALTIGTLVLWTNGKVNAAITVWVGSILLIPIALLGGGMLGI